MAPRGRFKVTLRAWCDQSHAFSAAVSADYSEIVEFDEEAMPPVLEPILGDFMFRKIKPPEDDERWYALACVN